PSHRWLGEAGYLSLMALASLSDAVSELCTNTHHPPRYFAARRSGCRRIFISSSYQLTINIYQIDSSSMAVNRYAAIAAKSIDLSQPTTVALSTRYAAANVLMICSSDGRLFEACWRTRGFTDSGRF